MNFNNIFKTVNIPNGKDSIYSLVSISFVMIQCLTASSRMFSYLISVTYVYKIYWVYGNTQYKQISRLLLRINTPVNQNFLTLVVKSFCTKLKQNM